MIDWKAKFLEVYANLPYTARKEIVAVVSNESYTWNSAKIEVENNTQLGKQIIEQLVQLKILKEHD